MTIADYFLDNSTGNEFTGRLELLEEIYGTIKDGTAAVVLQGAGGSGKTAVLKRLLTDFNKKQFSYRQSRTCIIALSST